MANDRSQLEKVPLLSSAVARARLRYTSFLILVTSCLERRLSLLPEVQSTLIGELCLAASLPGVGRDNQVAFATLANYYGATTRICTVLRNLVLTAIDKSEIDSFMKYMFVHKMKSELIEIVKTHVHPHKRISALTYLNSMGAHISDVVIPLIHDESRSIEARNTDLLILSSMDSEHHDVMREIVFDDVDLPSEIRELGLVLLSGNSTDDELCPMSAQQRYRDIIYDLIPRTLSRLSSEASSNEAQERTESSMADETSETNAEESLSRSLRGYAILATGNPEKGDALMSQVGHSMSTENILFACRTVSEHLNPHFHYEVDSSRCKVEPSPVFMRL